MPVQTLQAKVDTFLKQLTIPSSQITAPRQKFALSKGSSLQITNYQPANNNHWEVELASPIFNTRKWYVPQSDVQIVGGGGTQRTLITYTIVSDDNNKLKTTAKLACNFWNRFILPGTNIVVRLGVFTSESGVIARAYKPYTNSGTTYGRVEFNTRFLRVFSDYKTTGTLIHEIGHILGFGWDRWLTLFDQNTGKFKPPYVRQIPELGSMLVEKDGGPGTEYSHWDEETFDKELMTGYKDELEDVLPVTIKVMTLLGHNVLENLPRITKLDALIRSVDGLIFSQSDLVENIDLAYFKATPIIEEIPARAT